MSKKIFQKIFIKGMVLMATLENKKPNVIVSGTGYADSIKSSGSKVSIVGGAGNDTIVNSTSYTDYVSKQVKETVTVAEPVYKTVTEWGITGSKVERTPYKKWLGPTLGWITDYKVKVYPTYGYKTVKKQVGTKNVKKTITKTVTTPVVKTVTNTNTTIEGGAGNDLIQNNGTRVLFKYNYGDGNDTITGFGSTDTLSITGDRYSSVTSGSNVIITVGNGKITLVGAKGKTLNIKGTYGNSTISSGGTSTTGGGNVGSTIKNTLSNKVIYGTSNADSVYNSYSGSKVTISAGAGNDSIRNYGDTIKVDAGAGNDSIYSYSYYSTISGGAGNDIVSLSTSGHHNVISYASGDGNDTIYNLGATDTLSITGGSYSSATSGSNVIITVGSDKITLVGAKGKTINIAGNQSVTSGGGTSTTSGGNIGSSTTNSLSNRTFTGTSNADTFYNHGSNVKMDGAAGNDYLVSFSNGSKVTLTGGTGNDTLKSWSAYSRLDGGDGADHLYAGSGGHTTIVGGAGNDSVINYGSYNSILGGAGNDTLDNTSIGNYSRLDGGEGNDSIKAGGASKVTIIGGKGNDTLWGGSGADTFIYAAGDGNDVIYGFGNNDLLQITGTFSAAYNVPSKTVAFKIGSTANAIVLRDFGSTSTFNVNGTNYKISGTALVKK